MAASNGDVEKCRAAFSEQGEMNMDDYRLRFERQDGQRTKTIHFKAIPHDGGEALDVQKSYPSMPVMVKLRSWRKTKRNKIFYPDLRPALLSRAGRSLLIA
jgi:hypothetical protein